MENYEINEHVHSRSVTHSREGEGSYDGSAVGNAGGGGTPNTNPKGNGKGKTKTKTNKGETKVPKKEKTEDQLARAVPLH